MNKNEQPILSVRGLKQYFKSGFGRNKLIVKAVDDISFDIYRGEVFSLVGESGCGKTTTGRTIIKLYEPTDGEIFFLGRRIAAGTLSLKEEIKRIKAETKEKLRAITDETEKAKIKEESEKRIAELKAEIEQRKIDTKREDRELMKKMQMIFQDPVASLNPRMVVKEIIAEGLRIAGEKNDVVITKRVNEMLNTVGLLPEHATRYPHEFSGGQRQRIGVARALATSPEFIIADEPVSALDVSIRAQVINLLNDLRDNFGITILFVAHDLSLVKYFSDRIAVMYYGKIVEMADKNELFNNPLHPYTRSLLSAVPLPDPYYERKRVRIPYNPSVHDYRVDKPSFREIKPGHFVYANDEEFERYKKELKD